MGLNELAYQIFSEQMEEFATRNERMIKGNVSFYKDNDELRIITHMTDPRLKKVLESQQKGVLSRGGSLDAPKYKGAKEEADYGHTKIVSVPTTSSKLRAMAKQGAEYKFRKDRAIKEAKKHEGAHDRRRAWNKEHQKEYIANKDSTDRAKAGGYI